MSSVVPLIFTTLKTEDGITTYKPMNTTSMKDDTGDIILCRTVNYEKFSDYTWFIHGICSNSIYYILRYKDTKYSVISTLRCQDVIKRYSSYWHGIEDIRVIGTINSVTKLLITVPEFHPSGMPRIYLADLNKEYCITNVIPIIYEEPKAQKNWMPFKVMNSGFHVIYQLEPLTVLLIDWSGTISRVITPYDYNIKGYHGS